jgi:hypothetical protein
MRKTRGRSVNQKVFLLIALLLVVVLGGLLWVFLRFILPSEVADTGIVMAYSDEEEIIPLSNRVFTFDRELVADWERLSPQDAFYSAPVISYGPDFTVRLSGQQVHSPKYEVYGEDLEKTDYVWRKPCNSFPAGHVSCLSAGGLGKRRQTHRGAVFFSVCSSNS